MPYPHPAMPPPAEPIRKTFDPWNSSSTGHQRADNCLAGSTSWRDSRTLKLGQQFRSGDGGGKRLSDTIGAGSLGFGKDGRKENGSWERGALGSREKGWRDVSAMMMKGGGAEKAKRENEKHRTVEEFPEIATPMLPLEEEEEAQFRKSEKQIFAGLTVYLNGSTAPAISDHKLKHLLASHGANISIALGRRSVTHVILGKHNDGKGGGAGGGLSASKIQKEITRVGGKSIKFVGVDWIIESLKAGKRLPEARFESLSIAPKGVKSVYGMFQERKDAVMMMDHHTKTNNGKG